jgi:hypothetical protein
VKSEKFVSNIVEVGIAEEQTDDAETKNAGSLAGFELKNPIRSVASLMKTKKRHFFNPPHFDL